MCVHVSLQWRYGQRSHWDHACRSARFRTVGISDGQSHDDERAGASRVHLESPAAVILRPVPKAESAADSVWSPVQRVAGNCLA